MITVSVSGEDTVARGLGTLTARLSDLSPAFAELDVEVEAVTTPLVPVLTGRLVDDLKGKVDDQGYEWGSDLVYAGVQSYGWQAHGIEPSGFYDAAERVVEDHADDRVDDLLRDTARRAGLI